MKKQKKLLALALALVLLLVGCAPSQDLGEQSQQTELPLSSSDAVPESSLSPEDEEFTFGLCYLSAYGLNPYTCAATTNRALFSLLYESLFTVTDSFRAEPVLCESFRMAGNGTTYRFTLLEGLCFSDGTPVTTADVEASLAAARKSSLYQARLSNISYYIIDDERTITLYLKTPYENFALMMDFPILKAETADSTTPIGTGAYYYAGDCLLPNANWESSTPLVVDAEKITLYPCDETGELRDKFEFGGADLVYLDPNSAAAVGFRCDYEVWDAPTTILHYIGFNIYSGYFANDTLRKAVTHIVNRDDIRNEVYGGFALSSVLPCSPKSDLYDSQLAEKYDYAPASFASAVEASGVTSSSDYENHVGYFIVCSEDSTRVSAAQYICKELQEYGLNIRLNILDRASYESALKNGNFDLYYGEVRLTTNFDLTEFFKDGGKLEYGSIASSSMETLCREALANSGTYVQMCAQFMELGRICPVVFKSNAVYVTRGKITQMEPGVDCVFRGAQTRTLSDADKTYESTSGE